MNVVKCPNCNTVIETPYGGWESHIEERKTYLFDCDNCGIDLCATWIDDDEVQVILDPGRTTPITGAELHRNKGW
jgi:hypothetical protein